MQICEPVLDRYQFPLLTGLVFHDITRHRARRHCQRTREIHLPRPAASGEVAVLGADHNLVGPRGNARTSIDTSAATRLNGVRTSFLENIQIALANAVLARLLRSKLNDRIAPNRLRACLASPRQTAPAAYISISSFLPAVQVPPYASSTGTGVFSSRIYLPFPGSPGVAIIGVMSAASSSITCAY